MDADPDWDREQIFHNTVREYIIFFLFFILLNVFSYFVISTFKRREREEYYPGDDEEAKVYRISLWICTFALAVSVGTALLLPLSILSNEILILYPKSFYVQWLNSSLIHGLWNLVFLFSNSSLFILLPFAYLFTEAEGFSGSPKGLKARAYETCVVLTLLSVLVLGMTYILSALLDQDKSSLESLFNVWNYYLPFLYSCVSFLGVLMLLLCTPLGFAKLFTIVGKLIAKPKFLGDISEEYYIAELEEASIRRKLNVAVPCARNGTRELRRRLVGVAAERQSLDRRKKASSLQRIVGYPVVMLLILVLTIIPVLMVVHNMLQLLIGFKGLPISTEFTLGITSLSSLGPKGAILEVTLIIYLMLTSLVGFYVLPVFSTFRPRFRSTPITHVLFNCAVLLILSAALPLLSRILGITNFDLLGDFGRVKWLGNFYIVLFYNGVFAVVIVFCLVAKFTSTVGRELWALCSEILDDPVLRGLVSDVRTVFTEPYVIHDILRDLLKALLLQLLETVASVNRRLNSVL